MCRKYSKYRNCTDWKTDPRKSCYFDGRQKDISWYYWNLYYSNDKIIHGGGVLIHHKNEIHEDNNKDNLQKMTIGEHQIWHNEHRSDETIRKMSESKTGVPKSEAHKKNMSEAMKGEKNPRGMLGKKHTPEVIRKKSEDMKGKNTKEVIANFLNFESLGEAGKYLGVYQSTITYRIKTNKSGYSYK